MSSIVHVKEEEVDMILSMANFCVPAASNRIADAIIILIQDAANWESSNSTEGATQWLIERLQELPTQMAKDWPIDYQKNTIVTLGKLVTGVKEAVAQTHTEKGFDAAAKLAIELTVNLYYLVKVANACAMIKKATGGALLPRARIEKALLEAEAKVRQ
jgi:hypothetical protein